MPKKRFSSQYSKPQSTVHPSLSSATSSSSSNQTNDALPTVNELISSLRKSALSSNSLPIATTITTPTLPPLIRHLLSHPEHAPPIPRRARRRQRHDINGNLIPAGPAPPRSWLEGSVHAPTRLRSGKQERVFPTDVGHLPGLVRSGHSNRSLQDQCMKSMARQWEYLQVYERNNLADLPVPIRMQLLSYIAVYGPDNGVGTEGLRNLILHPVFEGDEGDGVLQFDAEKHNEGLFRLDLSGAIGHSLKFENLVELVQKPLASAAIMESEMSWEDSLSFSSALSPPIPHLTHLSLSHPAPSTSWRALLDFVKHVPTLTHLSLAFWPVPSRTPNATTAVVQSKYGRDIQYGGSNYYSHSLDNDFREASEILKKLAGGLYSLEYLDLSGCVHWLQALRWTGDGDEGINWGSQWLRLKTLTIHSGMELTEASHYDQLVRFVQAYKEGLATEAMLGWWMRRAKGEGKRIKWVEVSKDNPTQYEELWRGNGEEEKRKRSMLDSLQRKEWADTWRGPIVFDDETVAHTNEESRRRRDLDRAWDTDLP